MRMKSNHDANVKGDEDEDEDDEETATVIGIHHRVGRSDSSILDRNDINNTDHDNDNNDNHDHDNDTQIDMTLRYNNNNIKFYENPIQRQLWDQSPVDIHIGWNFIVRRTNHAD